MPRATAGAVLDWTNESDVRNARRALIASTVGTMIEWYDFYIYGLVAAVVFGKLYFPSADPFSSTLLSFSTFFLGFVSRPFGAFLFGHFGDRLGRKTTLISSLLLMGISTVAIGLVPTYESIGIWGGVLLSIFRMLQGVGVGGEWGGAIAVATEWSQFNKRRGLAGAWPQFGSPVGLLLAVGVITLVSHLGTPEWFETVGWRIPFLLSVFLIGVGLYIRLGVVETPIFQKIRAEKQITKSPVIDTFRYHWREVALTCLIRTGQHAPFVIFTTFLLAYGTGTLKLERSFLFSCILAASCVSLVTTPLFGYLSDIFGRKKVYLIGAAGMFFIAFPYFLLIDTRIPALIVVAVIGSMVIHDIQYGPQAAFISESFPPNVRYTGSSLGYHFAAVTSGGPAPLISAWLLHTYGTVLAVSAYIAIIAAISFISACFLKDRSKEDYSADSQR